MLSHTARWTSAKRVRLIPKRISSAATQREGETVRGGVWKARGEHGEDQHQTDDPDDATHHPLTHQTPQVPRRDGPRDSE